MNSGETPRGIIFNALELLFELLLSLEVPLKGRASPEKGGKL
jgi:hypothetical protein